MKRNQDPNLRQVLRTWQVSLPPAHDFKASVWNRIARNEERATTSLWDQLREWLCFQLPKPAYALALLFVTVVFSSLTANFHASHMREQYREKYARQYLNSIDPLAMAENTLRPSQ